MWNPVSISSYRLTERFRKLKRKRSKQSREKQIRKSWSHLRRDTGILSCHSMLMMIDSRSRERLINLLRRSSWSWVTILQLPSIWLMRRNTIESSMRMNSRIVRTFFQSHLSTLWKSWEGNREEVVVDSSASFLLLRLMSQVKSLLRRLWGSLRAGLVYWILMIMKCLKLLEIVV